MSTVWLTPEQLVQLEQVLWASLLAAHGEKHKELRVLHAKIVKMKQALESTADTELIEIERQGTQLAKCAQCGHFFRIGGDRPKIHYCSRQCKVKTPRGRRQ